MRWKNSPEEFVVREVTDLRIRKQPAPYRVYMLEKKGWNTADALSAIAREKRVPLARFAYGGKKDRYGHTFQYVTVHQHPADLSLTTPGYSFKWLGYAAEPMAPGRILANRFELTVREVGAPEVERVQAGIRRVKAEGFPNYFDDQRFGSYDPERGFIMEQALLGRWEEALAIALTAVYPGEKREAKERKRALRERWGDWPACRELARTAFEQRCFDLLAARPGAFREALATARREELEIWVSAYQSFLWNETLRRLMGDGPELPGTAGPYRFAPPNHQLQATIIPLPGRGMRFPQPEAGLVLEEVLRERRLRPAQLEGEVLPGLPFRASPREAWVVPQSFWAEGPAPDERYKGAFKFELRFTLPRGCYATMLLKALTI
ncbi:MAG: tRNA pseudouridine(13) synthase TruD [Bacillota bacterium]